MILIPCKGSILRRVFGVGLVVVALMVGACSSPGTGNNGTASGDKITVAASFYPLAEAAQQVGRDAVVVTNLTPPGVEPHDLELTPGSVSALQSADLVVYLGGGFQPAVEEASNDANGITLDALQDVDTNDAPSEEAAAEGLTVDPHVWLDPSRYITIVDEVSDALSGISPNDAEAFKANAEDFTSQLGSLDEEYRTGLASCERHDIVTNHAAFGYLAERYGLTQVAISGLEPDAEPTPQHLAELVGLVEEKGITTIFTEELLPPDVAETLAAEAGVSVSVLNTLETAPEDGGDYFSAMRDNLNTLREALGCS
jgi:zinc transport system substrate-binding protein